jgi:hypothetical protein
MTMKFDVEDCNNELAELKIPQLALARILRISPPYVSLILSEAKPPTDAIVRQIYAVCQMVRSEHLRTGGFALTTKNIHALQRRLDEMEKKRRATRAAEGWGTGRAGRAREGAKMPRRELENLPACLVEASKWGSPPNSSRNK